MNEVKSIEQQPSNFHFIHENKHGFYIFQPGGNAVFLPPEMLDFIDDWLGGTAHFVSRWNASINPKVYLAVETGVLKVVSRPEHVKIEIQELG